MCGIAGLVGRGRRVERDTATRMVAALAHRGPDDRDSWRRTFHRGGRELGVGLAHHRLAILDLSPRGRQPMTSHDGLATVILNGEIYNFRELREELAEHGHFFDSQSDTEVLLEAYRAWGEAAIDRLRGMFAFALWDHTDDSLLLVRDRLGIKPLYYRRDEETLVFGSELGALKTLPWLAWDIDQAAVGQFLRRGYVGGRRTIYARTRRLLPGELLRWRRGEVERRTYWTPLPDDEAEPCEDDLHALLLEAVADRLVADVPIGALLSGGIDSTAVVALMKAVSQQEIKTFSVGFAEAGFDEAPAARRVARHLGTDHSEIRVERGDALEALHELPLVHDEPFGDASALPTLLVSRLARQSVKVVLTGDGGDELFGGYSRYRRLRLLARLRRLPRPLRQTAARAAALLPESTPRRYLRWLGEERIRDVAEEMTSRLATDVVARCCGADAAGPRGEYLEAFDRARGEPAQRAMAADVRTSLADDMLTKVDRASMSVGLEARVPILDHRVARFALALPLERVLRRGETKVPLRRIAYRYVPKSLLDRPKHGFSFPILGLLGPELDSWTQRYLTPARLEEEGVFEPAATLDLVATLDRRRFRDLRVLWYLLCFERWFARHIRGESEV